MAREIDERIGPCVIAAIARKDAHAREEFVLGEIETIGHPRGLQRGQIESTNRQGAFEAGNPLAAQGAVTVVEHPGARPVMACII